MRLQNNSVVVRPQPSRSRVLVLVGLDLDALNVVALVRHLPKVGQLSVDFSHFGMVVLHQSCFDGIVLGV